jgi:pilus assembly protein CpaB
MGIRIGIMIALAVVFGAGSVFLANSYLANAGREAAPVAASRPEVEYRTLVVAAQPLSYGDALTAEVLTEIPWPEERLPDGAFATVDAAVMDGTRLVLAPIAVNAPVLDTELSGEGGRAALSNRLSPGMRAATVKVDEVAGVGGFITPGDRVDVVLTRDVAETTMSEIILQNVRVLSTDHLSDTRETGPRETRWITLEVDVEMAKKLTLARAIGQISLSLRAAGDERTVEADGTTIADLSGVMPAIDAQVVSSVTEPAVALPPVLSRREQQPASFDVIVTRALTSQTYDVPAAQPVAQ